MANIKIEIQGKQYPIKFGYGAFRWLGSIWKLKGMNDVFERLSSLDGLSTDFSFEHADVLADLILAGISNASEDEMDIWQDDVLDAVMHNPEIMVVVMEELVSSFPQPKEGEGSKELGKKKKA